MHIEQAQCDHAQWNKAINHGKTKTSNHYNQVITMLIHTWNEQLDIQDDKHKANHLNDQHSTNVQYMKYVHLGKILHRHKSDSIQKKMHAI